MGYVYIQYKDHRPKPGNRLGLLPQRLKAIKPIYEKEAAMEFISPQHLVFFIPLKLLCNCYHQT